MVQMDSPNSRTLNLVYFQNLNINDQTMKRKLMFLMRYAFYTLTLDPDIIQCDSSPLCVDCVVTYLLICHVIKFKMLCGIIFSSCYVYL
jgi:hypothetical protein